MLNNMSAALHESHWTVSSTARVNSYAIAAALICAVTKHSATQTMCSARLTQFLGTGQAAAYYYPRGMKANGHLT